MALCKPEEALIHQNQELLQKLRKVSLNHVKAHQDDSVPYERLPLPARLNVDCDTQAKRKMKETGAMSGRATPPEGTEIAFYMGNDLVTTNLNKRIQLALYGNNMVKYLQDKFEWIKKETNSIHFKATSLAKTRLSHAACIRVSKMMHKWLNIGHQKERICGSATNALCPCCGLEHENQDHMFCCQSAKTRRMIKEGLKIMEKVFRKDNIPSEMARSFLNKAKQATAEIFPLAIVQCPEAWNAVEAQDDFGTMAILRGHRHNQWYYAMSKTYQKRSQSPGAINNKTPKDKSPLELCATLVRETWCLFETI